MSLSLPLPMPRCRCRWCVAAAVTVAVDVGASVAVADFAAVVAAAVNVTTLLSLSLSLCRCRAIMLPMCGVCVWLLAQAIILVKVVEVTLHQVAPVSEIVLPPLKVYTFYPVSGAIISRTMMPTAPGSGSTRSRCTFWSRWSRWSLWVWIIDGLSSTRCRRRQGQGQKGRQEAVS